MAIEDPSPPIRHPDAGRDCLLLIPYYEAPAALIESLRSVVDPDRRVHVVVVDDGSTRHPAAALAAAEDWPFPLTVDTLPTNAGIEHALNHGLVTHADGYTYVARLDCGDTCTSDRFVRQLEELDRNPELLLLGGAAEFVLPDGTSHVEVFPTTWLQVRRRLRVNSAFLHPGVVFRTSVLDVVGLYPTNRPAAEDYSFFWAIAEVGEARNLAEVVVRYAVDPQGISSLRRRRQILSRIQVMLDHFSPSPLAIWGLARTAILYPTPRTLILRVRRLLRGSARPNTP